MTSPKKKKGHRLIRCTFSMTSGLNMPPNVYPIFFFFSFFGDVMAVTNFSAKIQPHLLKLPEIFPSRGGQCPPGPPTSYAYDKMGSVQN